MYCGNICVLTVKTLTISYKNGVYFSALLFPFFPLSVSATLAFCSRSYFLSKVAKFRINWTYESVEQSLYIGMRVDQWPCITMYS
jgi:hypothetical protein